MPRSTDDTIAAIATPLGEGGLGVIRVSGPGAMAVCDGVFRFQGAASLAQVPAHTCHVGPFEENGCVVERGIATVFRAPRSYTGQDTVEFSTHGGVAVLRKVLSLVLKSGARLADPGEFTQRAFLNGKLDLAQAAETGAKDHDILLCHAQ